MRDILGRMGGGTEWYNKQEERVQLPKRFFATLEHNNEDVFVVSEEETIRDMGARWKVNTCKVYSLKSLGRVLQYYCPVEGEYECWERQGDCIKVYLKDIKKAEEYS